MAHMDDYVVDAVKNAFVVLDSEDNALAVATKAAVPGSHHVIRKVDASYSSSTTSGLLTVKIGTATLAEKYIHGAGAIDFGGDFGYENPTVDQAVSAELAASGAGGVVGKVVLSGFTTGHSG